MIIPRRPERTPPMPHDRTPRVSVVIPAWNRRGTLRMSVESVLRQTFTDFELIVVDDGSTDGTMAAIADITDPRLRRLAHETNKGVSAARNTGIRAARAAWVAFNDSDDEWLPLKLEKQMARLEGAGPEVVACYTGLMNAMLPSSGIGRTYLLYQPSPHFTVVEGDLRKGMLAGMLAAPQTIMARRSVLIDIGGFDEAMSASEDWDLNVRLTLQGNFDFLDEPLVNRSLSSNSISHDLPKMLMGRSIFFKKHHARVLAAFPQLLVKHHIAIAGVQRRLGDLMEARQSLAAAARLRPFSLPIRLRQLRLLGLALRRP